MVDSPIPVDDDEIPAAPNAVKEKLKSFGIVPDDQRPPGCSNCPYKSVKVGSRGPADSPFVIVGESPGSNEVWKGFPFVGESGEMLEDLLEKSGIYEKGIEPYIINAVQCLPQDKSVQVMGGLVKGCQNRLYEDLAKHPRKVILALGASAAWSLTNDFGLKITQERGKLYPHTLAEIGVVTAVHPAFLMRQGSGYLTWKKDIFYACDLMMGKDPKAGQWAPPMWSVIDNRQEYEALVERMSRARQITGDIETGGHDAKGIPFGLNFQRGHILMLGITSNLSKGRHVDIIPGSLLWECEDLTHKLMGLDAEWIWQNGKFDVKFFRYEGIHEARVDGDLMLASYTLNENKGHDLDTIAWDYIGAPAHKHAVSNWFKDRGIARTKWDYGMLPKMELLYPYAALDISKTHVAYQVVRDKISQDRNCEKLYVDTLIPASEFLTQIELKGLKLDPEQVQRNNEVLLGRLGEVEKKIQVYANQYMGRNINIGSWQQLQELLYAKMKLGPMGSSTDEDALIKIQRRHDHPIATNLLQWRKIAKQRNTYVKPALDRWEKKSANSKSLAFKYGWVGLDGRVHCSYKLHGTTTGRLASSEPNMQNIPRDALIRGQFIAEEGKTLVEIDLNQAELRCLALMSGDPTLLDIYQKNEVSIHDVTSRAFFGDNYTTDDKMKAKAVNFGIVYGRTAPSLAVEFDISVKEAQAYIDAWLGRYPVAAKFIQQCRQSPHNQKTLINAFGRKKRWGLISRDNYVGQENEAANWPAQSTAHDICLRAGIEVQPVVKRKWDADIVNEIHDALYFEVDDNPEVYDPMIRYVQSVMSRIPLDVGLTKVPFIAEAKVGKRWGSAKNAKELGVDPAEYMIDWKPLEEAA